MNKKYKYRLNYDWFGYKKGHVFESDKSDNLAVPGCVEWGRGYTLDLLIVSGALTLIGDEKVELPELLLETENYHISYVKTVCENQNQIIKYLKLKEKNENK